MPTERRVEKFRRVLQHRQSDLTVVCENIHDPHNVSAIFRSADAVGIDEIQLLYTQGEEFPKLGKKSSGSARKWIDAQQFTEPDALRYSLHERGFRIYGTSLVAEAIPIHDVDWTQPAAIVVGNEHRGISDEALAISDQNVFIPQFGMIESLNVSVATAVILYEAMRQRKAKGMYPRTSEAEIEARLAEWLDR